MTGIGSWFLYDYFREPGYKEGTGYTAIFKAPKVLKAGHVNQGKWTIAQISYNSSDKNKKYYRNKGTFEEKMGDVYLGTSHIATVDTVNFFPDNVSREKRIRNQETSKFQIHLYEIKENNEQPKEMKIIDLFEYKGFKQKGSLYYFVGFSVNDRYVILNHIIDDGTGKGYLYIDLKDYSLKEEKNVPEEFHYVKPNSDKYIEFQTTGAPDDYISYFVTSIMSSFDERMKPNFLKEYPEVKEYMGNDKKMILNFSRSSDSEKEALIKLLESND